MSVRGEVVRMMPRLSEHPMLKHCPSIRARDFAEQCPTNAPYVLTLQLWLLEHPSHAGERAQGGSKNFPKSGRISRAGASRTAVGVAS